MSATAFVIAALPQPSISVAGETKSFPVRRIWCVGRNYLEHIREMGNDERAPPFFFAKHADRKSTRLNSSHQIISYAVFCLKKKNPLLIQLATYAEPPKQTHAP